MRQGDRERLRKGPGLLLNKLTTGEYALARYVQQVMRVRSLMERAKQSVASRPLLLSWARSEAAEARDYLHDYHVVRRLESGVAA